MVFDLSTIPGGSTVNWATLTLNVSQIFGVTRTINLHRITTNWGASAETCTTIGGDYDGTASDVTTITWPGTNVNDPITWDVATDVQDFLDGTHSNYG